MDAHFTLAVTRFERELSDLCYDMLAASSPIQVRQQVLGQVRVAGPHQLGLTASDDASPSTI